MNRLDELGLGAAGTCGCGPLRIFEAATRSSFNALRAAREHGLGDRVAGTPMSSALTLVHLPVPFWPAVSSTTSTKKRVGLTGSFCCRMSAVISIRNESSLPWFHSAKISPSSGGLHAEQRAAAGRRPRRSSACRRTRCRCGPSSRSGPAPSGPMYAVHGTPPSMGLPGAAPSSGLPVFASTLAAMAFQIGLRSFYDAGSPPGISEGPKRAPSSPPETPEPMKRQLFGVAAFSRRIVSVQSALPPSMMMSSCSSGGEGCR